MFGFRDGFEGLLPNGPGHIKLDTERTVGILKLGGTILGTTNRGHFAAKVGVDNIAKVPPEIMEQAKVTIKYLGIDALIVVGGDGSLTTAFSSARKACPSSACPRRSTTTSTPPP